MGDTGFEHTPLSPTKTPILASGGAKSDAQDAQDFSEPDIETIVAHWPKLPEHIKMAIKALIQTCVK